MCREGPELSINGSTKVSPSTTAARVIDPLLPYVPSSTIFFALSSVPPVLNWMLARVTEEAVTASRYAVYAVNGQGPIKKPTSIGTRIVTRIGPTMLFSAFVVGRSTMWTYYGSVLPSITPLILNWRLSSSMTLKAPYLTYRMVKAENK